MHQGGGMGPVRYNSIEEAIKSGENHTQARKPTPPDEVVYESFSSFSS